ncbi:RING finger protein 151-like [Oncorhynchus mykiss]|uniref:RING finger protein 151-like n=1 Tax=Oncorhynchus mykiss TaxID=8022 RepID=UPI001877D7DE|nr:RING finger protein 151-like [Oncorhynchus mykiss]
MITDYDLLCTICRSVLRCPVRVAWNHFFCKICILQWLRRQETRPYCRKPIRSSFMFVMYKLRKTISHLGIKCNNDGCSATFPLSEEFLGAPVSPGASSAPWTVVLCSHRPPRTNTTASIWIPG